MLQWVQKIYELVHFRRKTFHRKIFSQLSTIANRWVSIYTDWECRYQRVAPSSTLLKCALERKQCTGKRIKICNNTKRIRLNTSYQYCWQLQCTEITKHSHVLFFYMPFEYKIRQTKSIIFALIILLLNSFKKLFFCQIRWIIIYVIVLPKVFWSIIINDVMRPVRHFWVLWLPRSYHLLLYDSN